MPSADTADAHVEAAVAAAAFAPGGIERWDGFTLPEIAAWFIVGLDPATARVWRRTGFSAEDAAGWLSAFAPDGIDVDYARELDNLGVAPGDARGMCDSGHWTGYWSNDIETWAAAGRPVNDAVAV